jgi:hypothetical protein
LNELIYDFPYFRIFQGSGNPIPFRWDFSTLLSRFSFNAPKNLHITIKLQTSSTTNIFLAALNWGSKINFSGNSMGEFIEKPQN